MPLRSALPLLLLLTACAPELLPAPTSRMGGPLALSWMELAPEPGGLRLVARVEARAPLPAPVRLQLQLPAGVRLLDGPGAFTSTVQAQGSVQEVFYRLAVDAPPAADLVLEARVDSPGFGARAQARYAFGREAALGVRARPVGPPLPQAAMDGAP